MIKIKPILLLLCFFEISISYAQNKTSIITYRGEINQKYIDSFLGALEKKEEVPMDIKQRVAKAYLDATPDEFVLNIKNNESYYCLIPALESDEVYNVGSLASMIPFYTNTTGKIIEMNPYLGHISHKPLKWELTGETKTLGKYMCYQAIATERLYSRKGFYYNRQVIAWFAPEIPLNFGPSNYSGLPGLILEVQRDKFTLTATIINLNPDNEVKIIKPKENSKIITEEESHALIGNLEEERKNNR
ncbi:MAG: GLPGLI family protein [Xanthomarina gelatinilytica]|uniref:GLPGLI family protein n=1 Tax=Xanthomarina gelatinilytica TaxID=1137281 RepID=UPI003A8C6A6E